MGIKHLKDITLPDFGSTDLIQPSDWKADHVWTTMKADIDALGINAGTLDGMNSTDFAASTHNHSTFGSGGNNITFGADGTVTLNGTATSWDDLRVAITQTKQGANSKPDFNYTTITYDFPQNDTNEAVYFLVQMPHNWKIGSSIYPHVHWLQESGTGNPVFKLDYKWTNTGAAPAANTTYTMSTKVATYTSGTIVQISSNSTPISGSGKTLSSILACKLYRDDNSYVGDAKVLEFDIHYEIDSFGSNSEFVK